jgi:hypothetical protein
MKPTLAACSSDLRTDVDARGKPAADGKMSAVTLVYSAGARKAAAE